MDILEWLGLVLGGIGTVVFSVIAITDEFEGKSQSLETKFWIVISFLLFLTSLGSLGKYYNRVSELKKTEFANIDVSFEDAIKSLQNMGYKVYLADGNIDISE